MKALLFFGATASILISVPAFAEAKSACSTTIEEREQILSEKITAVGECSFAGFVDYKGPHQVTYIQYGATYTVPLRTEVLKNVYTVQVKRSGLFCSDRMETVLPQSTHQVQNQVLRSKISTGKNENSPRSAEAIEEAKQKCEAVRDQLLLSAL